MALSASGRNTIVANVGNPTDASVSSNGKLLAVANEAGAVHIFDATSSATLATLDVFNEAITRVAWANVKFGTAFMACNNSGTVAWWTAGNDMKFSKASDRQIEGACTSAAWAPVEFGPMVALASSVGEVHILHAKTPDFRNWEAQSPFRAHNSGCNSVSWCPCLAPSALLSLPLGTPGSQQQSMALPPPRLVTGGNERAVRIWRYLAQDRHWLQEQELCELPADTTAVADAAWASNVGIPFSYIAAATDEGAVAVWAQDGNDGKWNCTALPVFASPVSRVSWSAVGTVLCVDCADGTSTLWREDSSGAWGELHRVNE